MGRKIRCTICGDVIESKYRYNFTRCRCGAVAVDGGDAYTRLIAEDGNWEFVDDGTTAKRPPKHRVPDRTDD